MRISDWSSDVCSSDLLPYKILGCLLSLNGCCLMDDDRLAEFMQFSRKHRHKFKRIAKATRNECEHDDVQNEAWILAEHWEQAGRSEEHTSELQSLMRISYAVFCLKKKTVDNKEASKTQRQNNAS